MSSQVDVFSGSSDGDVCPHYKMNFLLSVSSFRFSHIRIARNRTGNNMLTAYRFKLRTWYQVQDHPNVR